MDRRRFLTEATKRGVLLGVGALTLPKILAACANDEPTIGRGGGEGEPAPVGGDWREAMKARNRELQADARKVVGDVVDFQLASDEWDGVFGFVTFTLHRGAVDGNDVFFIRTDASDREFAQTEQLVFVPKIAALANDELSGEMFLFSGGTGDQPAVLSSEPGRDDWTPAFRIRRVSWEGSPRTLRSVDEVLDAERNGAVSIERTQVVLNAAVVKWSDGQLAVDRERNAYLGPGQLLEDPDTTNMRVTFKLSECYPASRYIVTDHSLEGPATMTNTILAPRLQQGPTEAGATGRTNVLMNGPEGPGPMGFQPSAFDFDAGDPAWSPYWDHFAYRWRDESEATVLTSERAIHEARDAGRLEEFPGVPDTEGTVFTVNCPVPVLAPPAYRPPRS